MKNNIKEIIEELALSSTAYGVSNIFKRRDLFNKIFWIFFTLIATASALYYIFADISQFLQYEVVTVIKKNYEQPVEFPAVTFCSYLLKYFDEKNLTDLIIQTDFNSDLSINSKLNDHFEQFQSIHYGRCFRFNSGKSLEGKSIPIKQSVIGGYDNAFHLKMRAPNGLIVWIHNKSAPPKVENYNKHSDVPIFVSTHMRSFLVIDKIIELKLGDPYNNCLQDVFTEFNENKTILDYIASLNEGEKKILTSCTFKNRVDFHNKNIKEICSKYCPLECDSISYEVTSNTFTGSNVSNETIEFYAFYRNLRFLTITEMPKMSWTDLIANVGGYFGLFVGISFVTLFEIAELIFLIIYHFM